MTAVEAAEAQLQPVSSTRTLTEHAYISIKDAILTLKFKPGEALVEEELAKQLQTSKTPVRDALLALEREGLVYRIPYKGTYVAEIHEQDAQEIFQVRSVLEGLAGRLATPTFSGEELDRLEELLDAYDQALEERDFVRATYIGEQYHKAIIQRSSNRLLQRFLSRLDDQLKRLRVLSSRGLGRLEKSSSEHRRILAALRSGDPEEVEEAFRDHHHSVVSDLIAPEHAHE